MSLAPGTRLGPYEVVALLGAGGMGEVYKARDTRLGRAVAIKVLPPAVAADPDRRARFKREARAISHLSHPHICTLFDVGRAGDTDFLVMEYLEGETLAARLARGAARTPLTDPPTTTAPWLSASPAEGRALAGSPLPIDETLRIGTALAEALAAAHKAGILHRDLKPANVMLTPAAAKVLDFGVAKLRNSGAVPDPASSTTRPADPLTDPGARLGTLRYMAPERIEGREADARSDLFALGAILYEMAIGRRAFDGETPASVAAAILGREPDPVMTLQPLTPPALGHLIETCLAKDPEARWQAASDVARQLRWIADERRLGRRPAGDLPETPATTTTAARMRRYLRLALGAVALVTVIAATSVAWILTRTSHAAARPLHFSISPRPAEHFREGARGAPQPLAAGRPMSRVMSLSPDGEMLAFVAGSGEREPLLYVRSVDRDVAVPLSGTEGAVSPVFSPDGRWIAYWSPAGQWMKVPSDGSSQPVLLCHAGPPFGASWAPDDTIVFAQEWGPLLAVSGSGGTPRAVTRIPPDSQQSHRLPHVLPDGRGVLFTVLDYSPFSVADWDAARVEVFMFTTGERKLLLRNAADARYVPTGHLLYARRGALEAVGFDLARLEVTGGPVGAVPDVMQAVNTGSTTTETGAAQVALCRTGTLVYLAGGIVPDSSDRDFMWIDRTGRLEPAPIPPGPFFGASLSPDGRRLAFRGSGTKPGLWVYDFERSLLQNVTMAASHRWPLWTPDGKHLAHGSFEKGGWTLVLRDLEDGSPPQLLGPGYAPASWSRDGRVLVYTTYAKPSASGLDEQSDIWVLRRDGGTVRTAPWQQTAADEDDPALSPDGRWLAYTSAEPDQTPQSYVYVEPFPGHGGRKQVSNAGGWGALWSPDGKELFHLNRCLAKSATCLFSSSLRVAGSTIEFGQPREVVELPGGYATTPLRSYDTIDGRRFLYLHGRDLHAPAPPAPREMLVVLNWLEELKAKVPVK